MVCWQEGLIIVSRRCSQCTITWGTSSNVHDWTFHFAGIWVMGLFHFKFFLFFKWFIVVVMVDVIEDVLCHVYVQLPANPPVLLNCLAIRIWLIVVTNVLAFYMKLSLLSKFLLVSKLLVILFTIMPFCILIVWLNWLIVRISLSMLLSIKIIVLMQLLFLLLVQFH